VIGIDNLVADVEIQIHAHVRHPGGNTVVGSGATVLHLMLLPGRVESKDSGGGLSRRSKVG
jgi:hypothetical protein